MPAAKSFDDFTSKLNFYGGGAGGGNKKRDDDPEVASPAGAQDGPGGGGGGWLGKMGLPSSLPAGLPSMGKLGLPTSIAGMDLKTMAEASGMAGVAGVAGVVAGVAGVATAAATQKGVQSVTSMAGKATGMARSASTTISENAISKQRWMTFFTGALLGTGLMSLAFCFLPVIVLAPQKFALLFTLGSLCFMASFSALKGHGAFLRHLLSRNRAAFTATYVTSMAGTLWASLLYRSYLLAILFSTLQVTALSWFLVSYIPGGRRALGFAMGMGWRLARGCCSCASKGSLLPF